MPSYTNYQDSSSTLTIGNPLLSYFDVQLLEFLPHGLTCDKVKHQGPRRVRQGLLELIHNGLVDIIFQGQAVHIPVETPILDDHSSIQKVFGRPTFLYKIVFSMTNVLSIYESFFSCQKITLAMVFVRCKMYLVVQLLRMKLYFRRKTKYLQLNLVIKKKIKKKNPLKMA